MKRIYEYEDLQPVLERLLQDKESGDLEFKSAKGGFPHSFWETYSSFANTDGGVIVFGIKEKNEQYFQLRKYEKTGSGVDKIIRSWEEINWKEPYIVENKYHIYGMNVGLNVGLQSSNVGLKDVNVGLQSSNVGLKDDNVGLNKTISTKKRYSQSELRALIVAYCTDWRTADEIALKVGRNIVYIRDRVLPLLSDVMEKMYDIPHHPRQKYRVKQKEEKEA